jgi:hypothetical protein
LRRHFNEILGAIETVCEEQQGKSLSQMATALVTSFLEAKMRNAKTSVALYTVSDDVDGAKIVQQMGIRSNKAIVELLTSAREPLTTDPRVVASMLQGAMFGVSRRMLESGSPEKQFEALRQELIVLACAYLKACSARSARPSPLHHAARGVAG